MKVWRLCWLGVRTERYVETVELFHGSAIVTLIVGLSLQSTLGNLCSGLAIQMQRPFEVGDWIQFDDKREHIGKVREIKAAHVFIDFTSPSLSIRPGMNAQVKIRVP